MDPAIVFTLCVLVLSIQRSHHLKRIFIATIRRIRPFWWLVPALLVAFRPYLATKLLSDNNEKYEMSKSYLRLIVQLMDSAAANLQATLTSSNSNRCITTVSVAIARIELVVEDALALVIAKFIIHTIYNIYHTKPKEQANKCIDNILDWIQWHLPASISRGEIDKAIDEMHSDADNMLGRSPDRTITTTLVSKGRPQEKILDELNQYASVENEQWQKGKVSGTVYSRDKVHSEFLNKVYGYYAWSNPLHPGQWPKANQCEAEVIAMTGNMLHTKNGHGSVTSGGTESIVLAIRAHLLYYGRQRHLPRYELICGSSAHAAVYKACEMYGIDLIVIPCTDPSNNYRLDPVKVQKRITSNTIMIYASAPTYPQGVIDPIEDLSMLAMQYDIGLHVDACLGGFILPFIDNVPKFDFNCPGVTSMSADTHKFGYATKGTSVVLYRTNELRHCQYFCYAHWSGGMYATPTIAGSRPGGLVVCAWAAMMSLGKDGYAQRAREIVQASQYIKDSIQQKIPQLNVMTDSPSMVVCIESVENDKVDIYRVHDFMKQMGWSLNTLQFPTCIHVCVTLNVAPNSELFVQDLCKAVSMAKKEGDTGRKKGTAGIYGSTQKVPPGPINCTLQAYVDLTLSP